MPGPATGVIVRFVGSEAEVSLAGGRSLLAAISSAGLPIARACGGRGVCDSCRVRVLEGGEWLAGPSAAERRFSGPPDWRLACMARVDPDAAEHAVIRLACSAWSPVPEDEDPPGA